MILGTNIFLAKQAAELEKPGGLQVIDRRNLEEAIDSAQSMSGARPRRDSGAT